MLLKLRLLLEILGQPALWQRLFSARWGLVLFPALLGLITSCGFAPVGLWPLTLAGLSLSAALLAHYQTKKQIFVSSLSFFTAFSAASLWWLNFVLQGFGAMPVPLAWTVLLIFALYLALPYALLSVLARKLAGSRRGIFLFCFLPPAWCLADLIIGVLFGGFPWVYAGYTALTGPLSAFAPLIGVRGINLCFYLCAGAVALALYRLFIFLPAAGIIFMLGVFASSLKFTTPEGELQAVLVQGNIEQSVKWRPEMVGPTLQTYWALTKPEIKQDTLVVWPESAVPLYLERAPELFFDLNAAFKSQGAALITGVQHVDHKTRRPYNSLIVLGESELNNFDDLEALPRYDKRKLVPFGEVVPFADLLRPLGSIFNFPMSSFAAGKLPAEPLSALGHPFIPAICFEAVFPELFLDADTPESGLILMVSNDSWFGPTSGPVQHLNIARLRCMELQKPMLRATNSGITALIGADGKVIEALPRDTAAVLKVDTALYHGQTPFARLGHLPLCVLLILLLAAGFYHRHHSINKENEVLASLIRP